MDFNPCLYNETYRIPTNRMTNIVYGVGVYHIIICVKHRLCVFGKIDDAQIRYSALGEYVHYNITHLSDHYPDVMVHRFQIMPNHIHILLRVTETDNQSPTNQFSRIGRLPVVVRGFKSSITKWANTHNIPFAWQPRFYDAVIHDSAQYNAADRYIQDNPAQWRYDTKNNPNALPHPNPAY